MADKKTFLMYKSWNPMLENLPYEKLGELMYYILLYQDGEVDAEPTDPMVAAMFAMIKNTMDQDAEKYAEICAKRSESGKQGGRGKKHEDKTGAEDIQTETNGSETNQKKANALTEKREEPKKADNESDNDNENDTDKDNESDNGSSTKKKRKEKKKEPPVDYEGMVERSSLPMTVADKVLEWVQYKLERKEPYKEMGFKAFITQTEGYTREYGADNVANVINKSMASGYKGVVWDWLKNARPASSGKVDWDRV